MTTRAGSARFSGRTRVLPGSGVEAPTRRVYSAMRYTAMQHSRSSERMARPDDHTLPGVESAQPTGEGPMALARVVSFSDVSKQRIEELRKQITEGEQPEDIQATEILVLHDPEAEKSLAIVFFENEEDYRRGDAALDAMPAGDTPGGAFRRGEVRRRHSHERQRARLIGSDSPANRDGYADSRRRTRPARWRAQTSQSQPSSARMGPAWLLACGRTRARRDRWPLVRTAAPSFPATPVSARPAGTTCTRGPGPGRRRPGAAAHPRPRHRPTTRPGSRSTIRTVR